MYEENTVSQNKVVAFLVVILTCLIVCCCVFVLLRLFSKRRPNNVVPQIEDIPRRLRRSLQLEVQDAIRKQIVEDLFTKIPEQIFRMCKVFFSQDACIICFDEFDRSSRVRVIPDCKHVMHSECIR